jgi:Mlc titration factor MtfA (ptsG expression regulator)
LVVTDEIRVTIAGKACLLLLNRASEVYPQLTHVLVYPSAFVARAKRCMSGVVTHTNQGSVANPGAMAA